MSPSLPSGSGEIHSQGVGTFQPTLHKVEIRVAMGPFTWFQKMALEFLVFRSLDKVFLHVVARRSLYS